jgi:hypothetical protein
MVMNELGNGDNPMPPGHDAVVEFFELSPSLVGCVVGGHPEKAC